ncbi:hypothetical protein [Rhodococcus sp. NPDC049939]|uniref:hypothetical protein n=1 Tax=Rhodococcus sp. NPDC049939 TaxID=3155511 RepID=UPI0033FED6C0
MTRLGVGRQHLRGPKASTFGFLGRALRTWSAALWFSGWKPGAKAITALLEDERGTHAQRRPTCNYSTVHGVLVGQEVV